MSGLTQLEIEFLVSLPRRWRSLYWRELVRLLGQDALREVQRDAQAVFWRESHGRRRLSAEACFDSRQATVQPTVLESPQRRRN